MQIVSTLCTGASLEANRGSTAHRGTFGAMRDYRSDPNDRLARANNKWSR